MNQCGSGAAITTIQQPELPEAEPVRHWHPCPVQGCAWLGSCPDHDGGGAWIDPDFDRLMRLRPFGAGRKRQRSPARYRTRHAVRSKVTITSVSERADRPPVPPMRTKIVHPSPEAYLQAIRAAQSTPATEQRSESPWEQPEEVAPASLASGESTLHAPAGTAAPQPNAVPRPSPADVASILEAKLRPPPTAPEAIAPAKPPEAGLGDPVRRRRGRLIPAPVPSPPIRRKGRRVNSLGSQR